MSGRECDLETKRFIPVLTGNSPVQLTEGELAAVYPRAYGEQVLLDHPADQVGGLSPCLRGTVKCTISIIRGSRFIPVLTGNSSMPVNNMYDSSVYPRAYGEQRLRLNRYFGLSGLSPCLRGTGPQKVQRQRQTRFIPVLTGNRAFEQCGQS